MAWMGARSNVAAITALDVTGLQDNIVFAATSELKFLMLQKTSTATVDSTTVWAATPSGRWHLVGGNNSVIELANLAALKALTTASQDRFYILNTTPPIIYNWDAQSTATADDDLIVQVTAIATGRMYKIYPVASGGGSSNLVIAANIAAITALDTTTFPDGIHYYAIAEKLTLVLDKTQTGSANNLTCWAAAGGAAFWYVHPSSVIISPNKPPETGTALLGTTWIFAESGFESDESKSFITYVWTENTGLNANVWEQVSARVRIGSSDPIGLIPINGQEFWINKNTRFLYFAWLDSENGDNWVKVLT